jgi:hypothetical protein
MDKWYNKRGYFFSPFQFLWIYFKFNLLI